MFKKKFEIFNFANDKLVAEKYSQEDDILAGTYDSGLLTLVGDRLANQITFDSWKNSIFYDFEVIAYTAFGDVFLVDKKTGLVSLFEVQINQNTNIEINVDVFLNDFLSDKDVGIDILRIDYFKSILLQKEIRGIEYGRCLVLKPWMILGGKDSIANYVTSDFPIYLDLVGQTTN